MNHLNRLLKATVAIFAGALLQTSTAFSQAEYVKSTDVARVEGTNGVKIISTGNKAIDLLTNTGSSAKGFSINPTTGNLTSVGGAALGVDNMSLPSTSTGLQIYNTADQTTNYERLNASWSTNVASLVSEKGGSGTVRNFNIGTISRQILFTDGALPFIETGQSSALTSTTYGFTNNAPTFSASSSTQIAQVIAPTVNQSGTAGYSGLEINATETATGSGTLTLLRASTGGTTMLRVHSNGKLALNATKTNSGTTGAQTISKALGSVNFAAAATSLVVTNTLVTTASFVFCTVLTNDATMKSCQAVPGSGSFTIYPNANPTAETAVAFLVFN